MKPFTLKIDPEKMKPFTIKNLLKRLDKVFLLYYNIFSKGDFTNISDYIGGKEK